MEVRKVLLFILFFSIFTFSIISDVKAARYDYDVPHISQLNYANIGHSACAPTSITMLLRYWFPESGIDVPEVYHSGVQGYSYHGPAVGYKNVSFQPPDPGLISIVDPEFRQYYSGNYSGLRSPVDAAQYLHLIWGGETYGGNASFDEEVISKIKEGPLILNIHYDNNPQWPHYIVLRGYDDNGTPTIYSDDKFYVNDPYPDWLGHPKGDNREFSYAVLSDWYAGRMITFNPTLNEQQREHTVVVDDGNVKLDDINNQIWQEYYNGGNWYYPTQDGHSTIWKPNLSITGIYGLHLVFHGDDLQTNVIYTIYDPNNQQIGRITVNQKISGWQDKSLGTFYLKEGSYVQIDNVPAQCNVDTIRFEYIGPFDIINPTPSHPANAGPNDNPNKINIEVQCGIYGLNENNFNIEIGSKRVDIAVVAEPDNYILTVMPPTQDANGLYDLTVSVDSVSVSDTEIDAIRYSPKAANIDIVSIIDRSGSMGWYGYIDSAKNAAKQFIDLMSNGDQIGVVSFSDNARVDFSLSLITSINVKEQAKSAIDFLYAGGTTSVGDGLQTGQDQLTSHGIPEHPWAMILLSDGYENTPAWVADVLPTVPEKTDIYTIALGSYSDEGLLQDIATETGGQYYFSPGSQELQEIYSLIGGQIAGEQTITSKSGTVNEGETNIETVIIDSLVSLVRFLVSWSGSDIDLTLTDPNGLVIDPNVASTDPDISFTSSSTYEYYAIDSPNSGEWRMNIEGVDTPWGGENYTARVTGKSNLTLSTYFGKDRYETGQPITILASLSDASDPIAGATIEVVVQAPSQSLSAWKSVNGDTIPTEPLRESVSTLKSLYKESLNMRLPSQQSSSSPVFYLYDDGSHGDGQANDGVYGNLYTSTSNSGSYIFNFEASGTTNTGDPFTRITQRSLFVTQATATGSISGTISYTGSQTGPVYIQAWQSDPTLYGNPDYLTSISSAGSYVLPNLPDGTYYLDSYMDSNENGVRDENEPRGVYGPPHMPNSVIVSGGSQASDIDITLIEGIICYPNPCYLSRSQIVKIANLPFNSKVYIYTISGNLVRTLDDFMELSTRGSSAIATWDCKNDAGEEVARGIYIYFVPEATQKKTGKIAVIK